MRLQKPNRPRKLIFFLIIAIVIASMPIAFAGEVEASETYRLGDNVTGVLEGTTLTVSGTGATYNFSTTEHQANSPFYNNSAVTDVMIENGVTTVGDNIFYKASELRTIYMADTVERVGKFAFSECINLESIRFSDSLKTIGRSAFSGCLSLTELVLPEGLTTIGQYAFEYSTGIRSIFIPHTVRYISEGAFSHLNNLSQVVCLAEPQTVSVFAFSSSGTSVTPSSNKVVYALAEFLRIATLQGYNLVQLNLTVLGNRVSGFVAGDTHYVYGSGETYGRDFSPFKSTPGIRNIVISRGVTSIGNQLFAGLTEVGSITIPANVTTIGLDAFRGMSALREITYLYNGNATVNEEAFRSTTSPVTINAYSANSNTINRASSSGFTINLIDNPVYITHALASDTHSATVTVHAEAEAFVETEISINDGEWTDYTSPFTIEANATIKARASYSGRFYEFSEPYTISGIVPEPLVTTYTVEHYQQGLNGTYVKTATDNLTGTTGAAVTAAVKTYTGFNENVNHTSRVASGTISADGSTVLKLYYDRNKCTVSFINHSSEVLSTEDVLYGGKASAPTKPTRAFHTFAGWFTDNETFSNEWSFTDNQVTGNINLYAKWTRIPQSINRVNVDPETTITVNGLNDKVRLPEADNANTADIVVFVKAEPTKVPEIIKDKAAAEMSKKGLTMLNVFDIGLYKRITTYEGVTSESEISNSDITGKITVQIPLTEEQAKKDNLAIAYVDDAGNVTIITGKIVAVGSSKYFEFETDHFSMYSLVEIAEVTIPKTGEKPYAAIGLALLVLAAAVDTGKRRFRQENN